VEAAGAIDAAGEKLDMSAWWWVAIGLVAWFGVALAMSLLLSPFFRRSSQTRESLDAQIAGALAGRQSLSGSPPAKVRHHPDQIARPELNDEGCKPGIR
jgi:hypothetical protein